MMEETDYYSEITRELQDEFSANIKVWQPKCAVYFMHNGICPTLKKGVEQIIKTHSLTCKTLLDFALCAPNIKTDIFGVVVFGDYFRLIIAEVKHKSAVGLTELSQLLGYCVVSDAHYGLLINVDKKESSDLAKILNNQPDLTNIIRLLPNERGTERQTKLAIMHWEHITKTLVYSKLGILPTLGKMCEDIIFSLSMDYTSNTIKNI